MERRGGWQGFGIDFNDGDVSQWISVNIAWNSL